MPPLCIKFNRNSEHNSVGCTIGFSPDIYVGAFGFDPFDALHKAADLASGVASNPIVQTALSLAPGVGPAMKALSAASDAVKKGATKEDIKDAHGPTMANIVSKLVDLLSKG